MIHLPQQTRRLTRFALDNDALRRAVAVANRRVPCVRRGYKKSDEAAENY